MSLSFQWKKLVINYKVCILCFHFLPQKCQAQFWENLIISCMGSKLCNELEGRPKWCLNSSPWRTRPKSLLLLNLLPLPFAPTDLTIHLYPGMMFMSVFLLLCHIPLPGMFSIHLQHGEILLMFKAQSRNHIKVIWTK